MKHKKVEDIVNRLDASDVDKLQSIHLSNDKGISFNEWVEVSIINNKIPYPLYIIALIFYLTLVFMMDVNQLYAFIGVVISFLLPVLMVVSIDAYHNKIPLFSYMAIKVKVSVISFGLLINKYVFRNQASK